jgi:PKHD-type hydroxylase
MIFEIDLLHHNDLQKIQNLAHKSSYNPGNLSSGKNTEVKVTEVIDQNDLYYKQIYDTIGNSIAKNEIISSLLPVKKITPPMIVKYRPGAFYDWHIDELQICDTITHYSMTVFLNDPNSYEGGELLIKKDGKIEEYKLASGKALVYSTGMLHKVNEVISGERIVAISWIESLIKDQFLRTLIFEMGKVTFDLCKEANENNDTIKNANQKLLLYEQLRINVMREYGNF